jgi:hypothetical protein
VATNMMVAVSTRPNRQKRSTCSRMLTPLVQIQILGLVDRSHLSITLPTAQALSVRGSGGRSISFRKDECHVMHPLLRKDF